VDGVRLAAKQLPPEMRELLGLKLNN